MSKAWKEMEKMRNNPRDWRIEDVKKIADKLEIAYKQPGTSHVTFRTKTGKKLTIPAHKPIKPIYIKHFLELIDELQEFIKREERELAEADL